MARTVLCRRSGSHPHSSLQVSCVICPFITSQMQFKIAIFKRWNTPYWSYYEIANSRWIPSAWQFHVFHWMWPCKPVFGLVLWLISIAIRVETSEVHLASLSERRGIRWAPTSARGTNNRINIYGCQTYKERAEYALARRRASGIHQSAFINVTPQQRR